MSAAFGVLPALVLLAISVSPARAATDSVLRLTGRTATEKPGQWRVTFQDRGARPSYAERMGVGGVDGAARVDCAARRFQLEELVLYAEPRGGVPMARIGPRAEWRAAGEDTLLARVVEATCAARPALAAVKPAVSPVPPRPAPSRPAPTPPVPPRQAASLSGGSPVRLQLGAFSTSQQALQDWEKLRARGGFDLAGLSPRVESAAVGGKTYHRLLIGGFASRDAARDLCRKLTATGHPCFLRG